MSVEAKPSERLAALTAAGTSVWLDQIRRTMITSGELERLMREDSLRGVTSNPAIFEKAILGSTDYDEQIAELSEKGLTAREIYDEIAILDVQLAADVLRPVWDEQDHDDGFVSLEVEPGLAHDTEGTLRQAQGVLGPRGSPQPDGQDPRHRGGRSGDRGRDRSGHQRQRDAALLGRVLHRDRRGVHPRDPAPSRRRRVARRALGRELLRLARRHGGGQAARGARPRGSLRDRSGRQRPRRLRALQGAVQGRALRGAARGRRLPAAPALGLNRREGPPLPRDQVRRGAGGAAHGQHDADADAARLRGGARGQGRHRRHGPERGPAAAGGRRHRHGRRYEDAAARGHRQVRRALRQADRRRGARARGHRDGAPEDDPVGDSRTSSSRRSSSASSRPRARRSRSASGRRTSRSGAVPACRRSATGSAG